MSLFSVNVPAKMFGPGHQRAVWITFMTLLCCAVPGMGIASDESGIRQQQRVTCRDSWATNGLTEDEFANLTCSKCLVQLFNNRLVLTMNFPPRPPYGLVNMRLIAHLRRNNLTYDLPDIIPDPEQYPGSLVCNVTGLGADSCARWRQCCMSARRCCRRMLHWGQPDQGKPRCPGTWDGIACWGPTSSSTQLYQPCPGYYVRREAAWTSPQAYKTCTANATWWKSPHTNSEHTNYLDCVDIDTYKKVVHIALYIDIAGNVLSLIALVTSVVVIVGFRSLRRDLLSRDSLKLHLNLFVAMILAGLASLALHYVYFDKNNIIIEANPVWCRVLYAASKYFRSVTFVAIFSEGVYLHRRISRVLYVSRREPLLKYFLISWLVPACTVLAFCIARVVLDQNKGCWMRPANSVLEFIHMVPNAVTIVCNLGFLISIEVNLCTQMRTDSSDRRVDTLRHALRATLTLIPMFGLQFFFFAYRPEMWPPYEIIHALFISTQGFLVAVVYCFSTKEVRSQLFLFGKHCSIKCGDLCRSGRHGYSLRGFRGHHGHHHHHGRRESVSSAAYRDGRCSLITDRDGYLYMGQRRASHCGRFPGRREPRRSLPDIIDSMSTMTSATRTTSMGSSLCDFKLGGGDINHPRGSVISSTMMGIPSRRVSYDANISHAISHTAHSPLRRPSAKSLTLPCFCGAAARPGLRACTCASASFSGLRNSLMPLLSAGMSSHSDHSSTASGDAVGGGGVIPLDEREEEEEAAQEHVSEAQPLPQTQTQHQEQLQDGEGAASHQPLLSSLPPCESTINGSGISIIKAGTTDTDQQLRPGEMSTSQQSLADVAL